MSRVSHRRSDARCFRRGGSVVNRPLVTFASGTFTRSSEASFYTSAPGGSESNFISWAPSNVLRYDAVDNTSLALFEGSQTNLCPYSEDLNQAAWVKTSASISSTTGTAPDGAADCCTVAFTASAAAMLMQNVTGTTDGATYLTTVFVRKTSGTGNVRFRLVNRANVVSTSSDIAISTTWQRIEWSSAWGTGATTPQIGLLNGTAGAAQDVQVWGFDVKTVSAAITAPTSYIRTGATSATRNIDSLTYTSMPQRMATGRWKFEVRPLFSSAEGSNIRALYGTSGTLDSSVSLNTTVAGAYSNGSLVFSKTGLTYSRNQSLILTPDCGVFTMTVAGATAGNGTGSVGSNPSYATTYLRVGNTFSGSRPAYARIGEPYGA